MNDYILFMHNDVVDYAVADDANRWEQYILTLESSGQFDGGSAIGPGVLCKQHGRDQPAPTDIRGYIRVRADDVDQARQYLIGNPTYEAGGTVEIRELPRTSA
ncbi:hypothetical protein [Pseudoduganella violacea]|uniref:YCII-related domain-containing protein n=1 Tax=Pseudoduganella violacea TaxID=1715466 RepID=A0A7W5BEL2_9BURK|nr:hypothetical protein [Pseudoduganella violacea]MBB3121708.1 hypothetical protein [Pseudoduganella violacea]